MREIIFDTETTGFDPKSGHKIVEIGALETIEKIPTGKTFHVYINPEREIPEESSRIHGITNGMVEDKPVFAEIVKDMLEFFADSPLVAHNANFDMNFINHQLKEEGYPELQNEVIDSLKLAKQKFPGQRVSLDALCKKFDIDLSVRKYHGALLDSRLLAEVYLELTGGRQRTLSFDSVNNIKQQDNSVSEKTSDFKLDRKLVIEPTDAELENHKKFLEGIKDNIW